MNIENLELLADQIDLLNLYNEDDLCIRIKGHIIICDRYFDSSIAYQGYGRELSIQWLKDINSEAIKSANPDVTIFVDIPVEVSRKRMESINKDRMEKEGFEFLEKVRSGYLEIAREKQDKFITIDGTMTVEEIHSRIWDNIRKFTD